MGNLLQPFKSTTQIYLGSDICHQFGISALVFQTSKANLEVACSADKTKLWLSPYVKQCQNACYRPPPAYKDLSNRHDLPVKNAIVNLLIKMKENLKRSSLQLDLVNHLILIFACKLLVVIFQSPLASTSCVIICHIFLWGENHSQLPGLILLLVIRMAITSRVSAEQSIKMATKSVGVWTGMDRKLKEQLNVVSKVLVFLN